jgi:putative ABC transport system ATP-binding protein
MLLEVILKTEGLCKRFNLGSVNIDVLKDIDIEINSGEFVSIMGPSGSGKSTLLYLIGGIDKPTSGSISIRGADITSMDDRMQSRIRRKNIGFVFQFYNLVPNLSVEENILLPIILDGKNVKSYTKKLDILLEELGMNDRRLHTPRELSGGQQQRVAIARALINEPDIILADEPIGNLDTSTGIEVMKLLQKINLEKGKTIIQVTHSPDAAKYSHRIINIRDGGIL